MEEENFSSGDFIFPFSLQGAAIVIHGRNLILRAWNKNLWELLKRNFVSTLINSRLSYDLSLSFSSLCVASLN